MCSLKEAWMEMPDECFKSLTFGELRVGQKFIYLPHPGDNEGHGGLKKAHYLFIKTHQDVKTTESGLPYGIPHGRAINITRGVTSDIPHHMSVVLIE